MIQKRKDFFYRILEIFPGFLSWATFFLSVFLSYFYPIWVAVFIILFDIYWVLKAFNILIHLIFTFKTIKSHRIINWPEKLSNLSNIPNAIKSLESQIAAAGANGKNVLEWELKRLKKIVRQKQSDNYRDYWHVIFLPTVKETEDVLFASIASYANAEFQTDRIIMVLAVEERAGGEGKRIAESIRMKFGKSFFRFIATFHPDGIEGEARTKGANLAFSAKQVKTVLDDLGIDIGKVIVSAFDSDTIVETRYFAQLTYLFMTSPNPHRSSYQPVPLYNNNVWEAPAFNRLVAINSSFWQMVESSRPDRLVTFSSHSMSMQALVEVGYWPVDVVSEDSQIFWRCFLHYHGDYRTEPVFSIVSLDAVVLPTYFESLVGQYKQNRRWAWGIVDWPYLINGLRQDGKIPFWKKWLYSYRLLEGHYFWATAAIMIAVLGWLPVAIGQDRITNRVLASSLPEITGMIMTISTAFLIVFMVFFFIFLPKRPAKRNFVDTLSMAFQWLLVPVSSIVFGSLPAIDAQTRLMLGKYMEFWVTPKSRSEPLSSPIINQ